MKTKSTPDPSPSRSGPSPEQTALGGDYLEVTYLPKPTEDAPKSPISSPQSPVSETLFVRQLPLLAYDDGSFLKAYGHSTRLIALYCDRPLEWVTTLTVPSQEAIASLGRQLNFPTFERWIREQTAQTQMLFQQKAVAQTVQDLIAPLAKSLLNMQSLSAATSTSSTATD